MKIWTFLGACCFLFISTVVWAADAPKMPPISVSAVKVKAVEWQPKLDETGTLVAKDGIVIKPEVDGRISNIYFKDGQQVEQGALLFQLNPHVVQAELREYQAKLLRYQLAFKRAKGLFSKKVVSEAEMDQATSEYQSALSLVEKTQARLEQLQIKAPFSGQLGLADVSLGDYVSAGDALVNLQSIDPIQVDFNVPESYISQIYLGQALSLKATAYPNKAFLGKVVAKEALIDENTRTLKVRGELPNKQGRLVPGAFVEVSLLLGKPRTVMRIPQTSLVIAADSANAVYVVRDGKAVLTRIKLVKRRGNYVLIDSGLNAGDQVVTAGQMKLHDKSPVKVVK